MVWSHQHVWVCPHVWAWLNLTIWRPRRSCCGVYFVFWENSSQKYSGRVGNSAPSRKNGFSTTIMWSNQTNVNAPTEMDSVASKVAQFDTTQKATLPVAFFYRHMIPIPSPENMSDILTERQLVLWKTQKHPNYNQPWVNYFNSNDFLSSILPPGFKQQAPLPPKKR